MEIEHDAMTVPIAHGWRPGLIGDVAAAHGRYYSQAWNFGAFFEAKVARELSEFVDRYDGERDRLFSAHDGDSFLGALTIDGSDPALRQNQAHLRWFIMTDAARGKGIGTAMMADAVSFLRDAGYETCYLTTFAGLDAARALYERNGFRLTAETPSETWGVVVREQRFDLKL